MPLLFIQRGARLNNNPTAAASVKNKPGAIYEKISLSTNPNSK